MAKKNYQTGLIITGDAKGGIKAVKLTEDSLKKLNTTNKRTAKQSAGAWDKTKASIFGVKGAIGALGVAMVALRSIKGLQNVIDNIDKIGKLSQRLDITTEALSEMQHVAELSGVSFQKLVKGLQRQTGAIAEAANGTGEAVKALEMLNLSAEELAKLKPEDQFEAIADAMQNLDNQGQRVLVGQKLWGLGNIELLQTMKDGAAGIREMRAEAEFLGLSLSKEMTDAAAAANDNMTRMGVTFEAIGVQLTNALIPSINDTIVALLDLFNLRPERIVAIDLIRTIKQEVDELKEKLEEGDNTGRNGRNIQAQYNNLSIALLEAIQQAEVYGASTELINKALGIQVEKTAEATAVQNEHNNVSAITISAYDREIEKLIQKNIQLSLGERALFSYQLAQQKLTDTEKQSVLAIFDANKALKAQKIQADKTAKGIIDATNKTAKAQIDAQRITERALDDIDSRLRDLGATSLDIFTGPAENMMTMVVAIQAMSKALDVNSVDIATNQNAWEEFNKANVSFEGPLEKTEEFYKRDKELTEQSVDTKVQGAFIVGQALVGTIDAAAAAAEEGSKKQEALQKASLALQMVMGVALGAVAVIRGFAEGGYPLAIAVAAGVAVQLAMLGAQVASVGGGADVSELQKTQGTGTVLGDTEAVSESLSNSMELLEDFAEIGNEHSSKMLISLQNIDNNTKELGKEVGGSTQFSEFIGNPLNTTLLASGETISLGNDDSGYFAGQFEASGFAKSINETFNTFGAIFTGGLSGAISEAIGSNSGDVKSVGLSLGAPQAIGSGTDRFELNGQTLGDILNEGAQTYYFALIDQFTSIQGIARMDSFTANVFSKIEGSVDRWFSDILIDMTNVLIEGASFFDPGGTGALVEQIKNIELPFTQIDLTDLDDSEAQEAIDGVFSALGDTITEELFPQVKAFQQVGEGLFETFVRVVAEAENATTALSQFGFAAVDYTDVANKQNDIGVQIVRQTIILNEEFTAISDIMKFVAGDVDDLIKTYEDLRAAQSLLIGTGLGENTLSSELIGSSGGLGALQSNLESFFDDFFTEQERFDINLTNMLSEFDTLNLVMPVTKEAFRELALQIAETGDSNLLARLLALSPAVSQLSDDFDSLSEDSVNNLSSILNDVAHAFDRLNESAIQTTLIGLSEQFISTIESVIEAGGTLDDALFVANIGLHTGADAVNKAIQGIDDAFKAFNKSLAKQKFSVSDDILSLTNPDALQDVQVERLIDLFKNGDYQEQLEAGAELQQIVMQNYEEQISAAENLEDTILSIRGYLDSLQLNDQLSTLTPAQMLNEAESQFTRQLSLAQSGDADALQNITGFADTFLTKAREFFASSDTYTGIFDQVNNALGALELPEGQDSAKITADASTEAVNQLELIYGQLQLISSNKALDYQTEIASLGREVDEIYNEFIAQVSDLFSVTASFIEKSIGLLNSDTANISVAAVTQQPDQLGTPLEQSSPGVISDQQIQSFVAAAQSPLEIYNAAIQHSVTSAQLAQAMGWTLESINQWVDAEGLERFANGGISNQPAIFGEAGPEAAVPLPDGRSIPVTLSGNALPQKSYSELIAEIKGLRSDMAEQNSAIIESNYDANEQASNSINTANKENTESTQWQNNKVAVS